MKLFFKELGNRIQQAVEKEVKKILKEVGEERIYAVALVTDSDCITLYLALNTYEYMKKKDEEYIELLQDDLSKEDIKNVREGSSSLTKWIPDEWGYSDGKNSALNKISELLYAKEEANSEEYEKYTELFFETVTSALKHSIESRIFGENSEEITYFISMSDDDRTYEIENYSAKLLNSENVYEEFLKRTEIWELGNIKTDLRRGNKISLKLYKITTTLDEHPDYGARFKKDADEIFSFFRLDIGDEEKIKRRRLEFVAGTGYTLENIEKTDYIDCAAALLFSNRFVERIGNVLKEAWKKQK